MTTPAHRIPWYRPTLPRGLFALLGIEICLLLAEQCHRLGLLKDSGGRLEVMTLYTAWAAFALAGLFVLLWLLIRFGFRRRFQYSLRSLLLLTLLVSIGMSWIATAMQRAKRQREVAQAIEKMNGRVWWDYAFRHEAGFLSEVTYVDFSGEHVSNEALQKLHELPHLGRLNCNNSDIADPQLKYLEGLTQLQWLELETAGVTDEAAKELQQSLPNCWVLH